MIKHAESHFDHGLTVAQVDHVMQRFADRAAFFIETIELPEALGTVPCGLHGPLVGDAPVAEADVTYAKRGARAWDSRLVDRPAQQVRTVTVIAGPHEETCSICNGSGRVAGTGPGFGASHPCPRERCEGGKLKHACIVYTLYGGPLAPQEPGDPGCKDVLTSRTFWTVHALSRE
jgi:hypothetical protein